MAKTKTRLSFSDLLVGEDCSITVKETENKVKSTTIDVVAKVLNCDYWDLRLWEEFLDHQVAENGIISHPVTLEKYYVSGVYLVGIIPCKYNLLTELRNSEISFPDKEFKVEVGFQLFLNTKKLELMEQRFQIANKVLEAEEDFY